MSSDSFSKGDGNFIGEFTEVPASLCYNKKTTVVVAHRIFMCVYSVQRWDIKALYLCLNKLNIFHMNIILYLCNFLTAQNPSLCVSVWSTKLQQTRGQKALTLLLEIEGLKVLLFVVTAVLRAERNGCAQVFCLFFAGLKKRLRLTLSVH